MKKTAMQELIEDVGPSDIVFNAIKDAKHDLLTELLELI